MVDRGTRGTRGGVRTRGEVRLGRDNVIRV